MKKIILGLLLGLALSLLVRSVYADFRGWTVYFNNTNVQISKFSDGNINCYVTDPWEGYSSATISCVKVK